VTYLDDTAALIRDRVDPKLLPDEDDLQDLFRLYALLAHVKGFQVTAEDVHDAWAVWELERGSDHESIKPYADLDAETRSEDEPYVAAIRSAAETLKSS